MTPDDAAPDEKTPELRSPTETLVACLEDFGKSEPTKVVVVYVNVDGDLCWSTSGPYNFTHVIGMLECARAKIMEKFLE